MGLELRVPYQQVPNQFHLKNFYILRIKLCHSLQILAQNNLSFTENSHDHSTTHRGKST